jgi:hypothetical protein
MLDDDIVGSKITTFEPKLGGPDDGPAVGAVVGARVGVGAGAGEAVGAGVGVGEAVGAGDAVGAWLGAGLGEACGPAVGEAVGAGDGVELTLGAAVGAVEGWTEEVAVGVAVATAGLDDGCAEPEDDGLAVGCRVGSTIGPGTPLPAHALKANARAKPRQARVVFMCASPLKSSPEVREISWQNHLSPWKGDG